MKKENFYEILKEESRNQNIILNQLQLEQFELYKDLLLEWNNKMNLTAILDEKEIIIKHFIDCLKITKYIKSTDKVIDIGTGAGFPGIVIAIFYPNINITLLDSLNKRLIFLQEVIDKLNLKNINIIHSRAEELAHKKEFREKYDVVVSRAVASLNKLIELSVGYIKVNGKCIFMKGNNIQLEIKDCKQTFNTLNINIENIQEYILNLNDKFKRNIIILNKEKNTKSIYPRSYSKIKNNPL